MDDEDKLDPLTKKYLYWFLGIAILVIAILYFTAPNQSSQGDGSVPYSPTYTELPAGAVCRGQLEAVKPLSGGTKLVCTYP